MTKLDGRKIAEVPKLFRPYHRVTNAAVRRTVEAFATSGHTSHSKNATTLPYVLDYCHKNGIAYRLTYVPDGGFFIEKT